MHFHFIFLFNPSHYCLDCLKQNTLRTGQTHNHWQFKVIRSDWKCQTSHYDGNNGLQSNRKVIAFFFFVLNIMKMTHSHQICCGNVAIIHYLGTRLNILNHVNNSSWNCKDTDRLYGSLLSQSIPRYFGNDITYFISVVIMVKQDYTDQIQYSNWTDSMSKKKWENDMVKIDKLLVQNFCWCIFLRILMSWFYES